MNIDSKFIKDKLIPAWYIKNKNSSSNNNKNKEFSVEDYDNKSDTN